jgi:hypothetical protein
MLARTVRSVTRARWPGLPVKRIANQRTLQQFITCLDSFLNIH